MPIFCCKNDIATFTFMRLQTLHRPALFGSPTILSEHAFCFPFVIASCCNTVARLWFIRLDWIYRTSASFIEKELSCDAWDIQGIPNLAHLIVESRLNLIRKRLEEVSWLTELTATSSGAHIIRTGADLTKTTKPLPEPLNLNTPEPRSGSIKSINSMNPQSYPGQLN
jgi:hypothetical protein